MKASSKFSTTGDVYILAATARGCAFGEDMTARWREVEACQRRDAVQGYMNTYAQLKPEPKNKFDPQAIEVLACGEFFGHMATSPRSRPTRYGHLLDTLVAI